MGNRATGLGIRIPAYAESIGRGAYGEATGPEVEAEVLRLDALIKQLAPGIREVLITHYVDPRPKREKIGRNPTAYYARLGMAKEALRHETNRSEHLE